MKNLLTPDVKNEVLARIDNLSPESKALWGKMNVNQGLRHMAMAFDTATGELDPTVAQRLPMPKWLIKFFFLNTKPPKEKVQTFVEMNMVKQGINPPDFEAERQQLKHNIEKFYNATDLVPENKLAGKFNRQDWGKLFYNHTDHHLRQFGV
ncbi:DUF1569 domain-containing protein [Taibaiella soli]|uniref:DUF1569 domain-containing protein n=1 Tax=Taibaiella soli TaxID=1649169 RepID=A0A2W2B9P8_9BACT|nr:DUF1569 domain-containing protein [Taibaiella soli]PZF72637.1 hypothetical protein DN068_12285 [Taibaiella soli]